MKTESVWASVLLINDTADIFRWESDTEIIEFGKWDGKSEYFSTVEFKFDNGDAEIDESILGSFDKCFASFQRVLSARQKAVSHNPNNDVVVDILVAGDSSDFLASYESKNYLVEILKEDKTVQNPTPVCLFQKITPNEDLEIQNVKEGSLELCFDKFKEWVFMARDGKDNPPDKKEENTVKEFKLADHIRMSEALYEKCLKQVCESQDGKSFDGLEWHGPVGIPKIVDTSIGEALDNLLLTSLQRSGSVAEVITDFDYVIQQLTSAKKALHLIK